MAVTAADLIAPSGVLTVELLEGLSPDAEPTVTAGAYLAAAVAHVGTLADEPTTDRAVRAWAYHRALTDRAQQILTAASSLSADGEGSRSYSTAQAEALLKQAAGYLAEYEALVDVPDESATPRRHSRTTVNRFAW